MKIVVSCALIDIDGRILLSNVLMIHDGWFVGIPWRKNRDNETAEMAIVRELKEELDIDTHESCLAPVNFSSYQYSRFSNSSLIVYMQKMAGIPRPLFASKLKWVFANDLRKYDMPKANKDFISNLQDLL